jgi:hypothetical protein
MESSSKIPVRLWRWSPYRFRLFNRFEDNGHVVAIEASFRKVCFTHRCEHSLCHCNSVDIVRVPKRVQIPKKNKLKDWEKLRRYVSLGQSHETNCYLGEVDASKLTKRERTLYRLAGVIPSFYEDRIKFEI